MPEGHTIHRIALDHSKLLVGELVAVSSPQRRFDDAVLVDGQRLDRIEAYGKHLFYHWANSRVGHVHLGLFGKFRVTRHDPGETPEPKGMVRMRLLTDKVTIDLSGPTDCSIGDDADRACGIGNVYRAEVLFVAGIRPSRAGSDFGQSELEALWSTAVALLRKGVKDNGIITVERSELPLLKGRRMRRGEATYVYRRDRCLRCGTPVASVELGGRPCCFCPTCQPR